MVLAVAAFAAVGVVAPPEKAAMPLVVRLGVDLVRIDAVVTDRNGRPVTDLVAADFEVRQDGRPQTVTQVAYMGGPGETSAREGVGPSAAAAPGASPGEPPETLVFVVDDLALSLQSVAATTRALLSFADRVDPDGRVLLLRTSARVVDLRRVEGPAELRAAARALRYHTVSTTSMGEGQPGSPATPLDLQAQATAQYLNGLLTRQTLLSLQDITDSLRGWKGRKTLVLFSDGFPIWDRTAQEPAAPLDRLYGQAESVLDAVERLTDLANRASVVIHTVDPRGLVPAGISAADSVPDPSHGALAGLSQSRHRALLASQASLAYVAERTGGLAIENSNDVAAGVTRIVSGSRDYYLIGYEPERATFGPERPRFHRLEVKVKRRGVKVRSRTGFFGVSDEAVSTMVPPQVF